MNTAARLMPSPNKLSGLFALQSQVIPVEIGIQMMQDFTSLIKWVGARQPTNLVCFPRRRAGDEQPHILTGVFFFFPQKGWVSYSYIDDASSNAMEILYLLAHFALLSLCSLTDRSSIPF